MTAAAPSSESSHYRSSRPRPEAIAHAIGARIDAAGGTAEVADVIEDLLSTYPDIAETSIKSYLSTLEFIVTAGTVRRRTPDDEWPEVTPLNKVRGACRNGDNEIRLILQVNSELLRGSGQVIHPAVATAVGVEPGKRLTFTNPRGDITVYWKLASTSGVSIGSPRAHAVAVEATTADTLMLTFKLHNSSLEVSRVERHDVQGASSLGMLNAEAQVADYRRSPRRSSSR